MTTLQARAALAGFLALLCYGTASAQSPLDKLRPYDPALADYLDSWMASDDVNPATGRRRATLSKFAESGNPILVVLCEAGAADVYLIGGEDWPTHPVVTASRFDTGESSVDFWNRRWFPSVVERERDESDDFVATLHGAARLTLTPVLPLDDDIIYDLGGFRVAVVPYRAVCGLR